LSAADEQRSASQDGGPQEGGTEEVDPRNESLLVNINRDASDLVRPLDRHACFRPATISPCGQPGYQGGQKQEHSGCAQDKFAHLNRA